MNTITMICWKRPGYLAQALESLKKNDLSQFDSIHIFAEPGGGGCMEQLLYSVHNTMAGTTRIHVHFNERLLGVDANGFKALNYVFNILGSDLNMHVEEDVVVSPDATRLVLNYGKLTHDPKRLCFCLHNHGGIPLADTCRDAMDMVYGFSPYGWACTSKEWERWFEPEWFTNNWSPDGKEKFGWDWSINYHSAKTKAAHVLQPLVSRATTIGEFDGVNMTPEQWRADFAKQTIL